MYKTVLRPVVTYGSETRTLTSADELQLNCWERRALRTIYGPLMVNRVYLIRKNAELKQLYKDDDLW